MERGGIGPGFLPEPRHSLMYVPPESLVCIRLLFCTGIIGEQLDLLLVISSLGFGKHGISLCCFIHARTSLYRCCEAVMEALNEVIWAF